MSTDNTMFVKPVDKSLVRDPERNNQHLPADGANVPCNAYWLRRINEGSVVKTKVPKSVSTTKTHSASSEDK